MVYLDLTRITVHKNKLILRIWDENILNCHLNAIVVLKYMPYKIFDLSSFDFEVKLFIKFASIWETSLSFVKKWKDANNKIGLFNLDYARNMNLICYLHYISGMYLVNHFKLCTEFLQILEHCQKCLHFGRRHMRCIEMFCKFCNRIYHVSRLWYFPHVHTKHWLIFPVCSCSKWCLDRMPNEHKSTLAYLLTVRSLNPCCLSAAVVFDWLLKSVFDFSLWP